MPPRPPQPPQALPPPAQPPVVVSFCVAGYTTLTILQFNASLINGTGTYLQVPPSYIALVNVSTGCDVPIPSISPSGRRRLQTATPPPPPPLTCSSNSSILCVNGTLVYNASTGVTFTVSVNAAAASSPGVQSRILALGNTSSAGASPASVALVTQLRGAGLTRATGT